MPKLASAAFTFLVAVVLCVYASAGQIAAGFMSYALAGFAFAHLYWYRSVRDYAAFVIAAAVLLTLFSFGHPVQPYAVLAISGLASVGILSARWSYAAGEERGNVERAVALPLFVLLFSNIAVIPQLATIGYHTADPNLFRLDAQLWEPSWLVGALVFSQDSLQSFIHGCYLALGLGMIVVLTPESHELKRIYAFVGALVGTGLLGFLIYNVIPAVGPVYAYQGFPSLPPAHPITQAIEAPRNSFPSLHMAWAVLMLLHARRNWTKALAAIIVLLTVTATLGLGEHYAVDLLAAIPFTILVNKWVTDRSTNWSAAVLTAGWIAIARFGDVVPGWMCPVLAGVTLIWAMFSLRPTWCGYLLVSQPLRGRNHICAITDEGLSAALIGYRANSHPSRGMDRPRESS